MTVEEIFSDLSKHMIEGLMAHSQLSDYFGFLGLEGPGIRFSLLLLGYRERKSQHRAGTR